MWPRYLALIFGVVYAAVGALGFVPALKTTPPPPADALAIEEGYGLLLGLFPVNLVHNLVHIATGVWGIASVATLGAALFFWRANAFLFGILAIMGLLPALRSGFGLVPIWGNDVWLHALSAMLAVIAGWSVPAAQRFKLARHAT